MFHFFSFGEVVAWFMKVEADNGGNGVMREKQGWFIEAWFRNDRDLEREE